MKKITILFALFISIVGYSQTYKLYQTDNIHNQLKLNTKTGQVYQIQDDGQTFLVREAETPNNEKWISSIFFKINQISMGTPYIITSGDLDCTFEELERLILESYNQSKK